MWLSYTSRYLPRFCIFLFYFKCHTFQPFIDTFNVVNIHETSKFLLSVTYIIALIL